MRCFPKQTSWLSLFSLGGITSTVSINGKVPILPLGEKYGLGRFWIRKQERKLGEGRILIIKKNELKYLKFQYYNMNKLLIMYLNCSLAVFICKNGLAFYVKTNGC